MNIIQQFSEPLSGADCPGEFPDPFTHKPHPLAIRAAKELQQKLKASKELTRSLWVPAGGKMFGVLVVADTAGHIGYLAAFSGMLNGCWQVDGFVPPVFDIQKNSDLLREGERELATLSQRIDALRNNAGRLQALQRILVLKNKADTELSALKCRHLENKRVRHAKRIKHRHDEKVLNDLSFQSQNDKREYRAAKSGWEEGILRANESLQSNFENEITALTRRRTLLSRRLHQRLFDGYQIHDGQGKTVNIRSLFAHKTPPGGTGDCAAPKLVQYASQRAMKPVALAEFWWGAPPVKEVRHHGYFYAPCRGKCHPLLPFMLSAVKIRRTRDSGIDNDLVPKVIYEDDSLIVLNKPAGLLSVPGKQQQYSVQLWLQEHYPQSKGPFLVHRLDMATSGLLLAAKTAGAHKKMQKEFIERRVYKRYEAVLSRVLTVQEKIINLPLRVDLEDRPRQLVCHEHGKPARTRMKVIGREAYSCRVHFFPLTGRTHQLRVHAAHDEGLGAPIVGDQLYGTGSKRLLLHAESIKIRHPANGQWVEFRSQVPF